MNKTSKVFIAGHTGLIGSSIKRKLVELSFEKISNYRSYMEHQEIDKAIKETFELAFQNLHAGSQVPAKPFRFHPHNYIHQ